jgi:hypothetical protein
LNVRSIETVAVWRRCSATATTETMDFKESVMFKRIVLPLVLLAAVGMIAIGCNKGPTPTPTGKALCGGCGQIKGSDVCCKEGVAKCTGCELTKGSPGCCKITKGKDAALCGGCGQIKGSDVCCKEGAEKCTKCNLVKGSPGCCK